MAGLEDYLPSFFKPGDISDPRVNPQLRQKIAAALLAKEQRFPKTIGEGLSAIGEAIGQRRLMSEIYQSDIETQGRQPPAATGAAPTASTSYGGGDTTPPAVAAINSAITPGAQASGGEPSDGGYNFIDAQAGGRFKPTPGYLQDTIAAREPNPDMQAYFGSLAGSEAKGPRDVSPTGAAGPYQFTRGTGAQYGIPGNQRFDPGASTDAVRALTADNAATFQQVNNRPPTYQDLALMHQQGGTTGARMAAGIGNAPPGNLAVNNIPPGASPQQAVSKVNAFYGMPNEPAPVASRDAIAAQLTPKPPVVASGEDTGAQPMALSATPQPAIATAPPGAPIRQAPPPTQVAQAEPQQVAPGYVPPEPKTPVSAPMIPPSPREVQLSTWLANETARGNQYAAPKVALELQTLQAERANKQKEADELFKADVARGTEQARLRQTGLMDAPARIAAAKKAQEELTKAQQENQLRAQFGNLPPDEVFKQVNASKTIAKSAQQALVASQNATKALDGGAILGSGANQRLDVAKFFTGIGLVDKGNAIANTEVFKAAMQPIVASILHQTSGTSQLSDNELAFAKSAAAGNITLDPQSIRTLMTIIDKRSQEVLKDHQTLTGALFGHDNPQANALFGVEAPKPQAAAATVPEGTTATGPNGARMVRRGGKWEPM